MLLDPTVDAAWLEESRQRMANHEAQIEADRQRVLEREQALAERKQRIREQQEAWRRGENVTPEIVPLAAIFQANEQARLQEQARLEHERLKAIPPFQVWLSMQTPQEQEHIRNWCKVNKGLEYPGFPQDFTFTVKGA